MLTSLKQINFIKKKRWQNKLYDFIIRIAVPVMVGGFYVAFVIKIVNPELAIVANVRRSLLLFVPFVILVLKNAVFGTSNQRRYWSIIGLVGLGFICLWDWAIGAFPKAKLGQPPLAIYSIILLAVLLVIPHWRLKLKELFINVRINSDKEFTRSQRSTKKSLGWGGLGLILIIILFTLIKIPYFSKSFTGEHNLKYAWSVGLAQNMAKQNSPLWFQTKYTLDPVNNPEGKIKTIEVLPVMEWGLLATYKVLPFNDIETNTRIFTHIVGVILLWLAYLFFKKHFPLRLTLIAVLLMAVNPIISFSTFVTVYDSLVMVGTFCVAILIDRYINQGRLRDLFLAGAVSGICVIVKFSVFLWLAPIGLLLIWKKGRPTAVNLSNAMVFIFLSLLPLLVFKYSIKYLPSNPGLSLLGLLLWCVLLFLGYKLYKLDEPRVVGFLYRIISWRRIWFVVVPLLVLGLAGFIWLIGLEKFGYNFLTDSRLIANWRMYHYMLFEQFKIYMTPEMFIAGGIGLAIIIAFSKPRYFRVLSILGLGGLIYWVAASKVIFFHNYYTLIIMIVFCLLAASGIYLISCASKQKTAALLIIGLGLLFLTSPSIRENTDRLRKDNPDFASAAQYLIDHSDENSIYLDDESAASYFVVKTGRGRAWRSFLDNPKVKEAIQTKGFKSTMDKYHIKYLISQREEPNYSLYVNAFTDEELASNTVIDRGFVIQSIIENKPQQFEDIDQRQRIVEEQDLQSKFVLEKVIGSYRFYRFID